MSGLGAVSGEPPAKPILGVFGGSFDPPHIGHVLLPSYLKAIGAVDRLIVAPCAAHPLEKSLSPFWSRFAMTKAAMRDVGTFVTVSDIEQRLCEKRQATGSSAPSYALHLLEAVAAEFPAYDTRLVIGTDIIASGETERWFKWNEIQARFPPIVVPRASHGEHAIEVLPNISSSQLRELLSRRKSPRADAALEKRLRYYIPAQVLNILDTVETVPPKTIVLIGSGHVATQMNRWLRAKGLPCTQVGARSLMANESRLPPPNEVQGCYLLTRDSNLPAVAKHLAGLLPEDCPRFPVLHAAGALVAQSNRALAALHQRGFPVGTLHPICALRKERESSMLSCSAFGIEGDAPSRDFALSLVGDNPWLDLQGLCEQERTRYHAACALAANQLAVLLSRATQIISELTSATKPEPQTVSNAIGALMCGALDNLVHLKIPAGITGPVSRGDLEGAGRHASALAPQDAQLYRLLSQRLEQVVRESS